MCTRECAKGPCRADWARLYGAALGPGSPLSSLWSPVVLWHEEYFTDVIFCTCSKSGKKQSSIYLHSAIWECSQISWTMQRFNFQTVSWSSSKQLGVTQLFCSVDHQGLSVHKFSLSLQPSKVPVSSPTTALLTLTFMGGARLPWSVLCIFLMSYTALKYRDKNILRTMNS